VLVILDVEANRVSAAVPSFVTCKTRKSVCGVCVCVWDSPFSLPHFLLLTPNDAGSQFDWVPFRLLLHHFGFAVFLLVVFLLPAFLKRDLLDFLLHSPIEDVIKLVIAN